MDRYISIKQILSDILAHPLLQDVSFERAVNHTVHFMRIVGSPRIFEEKVEKVTIEDYRGLLPCDIDSIIQIRTISNNGECTTFIHSTDSFHMSSNKQSASELTYKVQGNVIFTSMKEGDIEVAYTSIAVDNEGYPLVPDNSFFIRALELYIKKQQFTILFDMGQLNPTVFQQVCQDYAWAVGQAQSDLVRPSIDQMQALTNSLSSLIWRTKEHNTGFINMNGR